MSVRCIIVDDEPLAIDVIESYLYEMKNIEIVAKCENALKAFEILKQEKIDLIFLDIQMPRISGIDFIKTLRNPPKIIITTAYREYALEGYELDIIDYLLKPIAFDRFIKAVEKFYKSIEQNEKQVEVIRETETSKNDYILVRADRKMFKIYLDDIYYIESLKDYVTIHTKGKRVTTKNQISYFDETLPREKFLRIHKSYIVNRDKIEAFSQVSIEMMGKELAIGRNYKNEVIRELSK